MARASRPFRKAICASPTAIVWISTPHIAPSHRLHCWREWQRVYTYGQTRDRVEYAQRRIAEVISGDPDPPFELPSGSNPSNAPPPASPASVQSPSPAGAAPAGAAPASVRKTGGESALTESVADNLGPGCRSRCEAGRANCAPGCETQPTGCQDCDLAFHTCLDNCKTAEP